MIQVTKIFRFEAAHALHGYHGACRHVHGHSYQLHVTVRAQEPASYFPAPGILIDFKDLKRMVNEAVVDRLDHALVVSSTYLRAHTELADEDNVVVMDAEPSAENLLLYIRNALRAKLPAGVALSALKLFETADSYAEWVN